jgi:3-methylcrotonyl-CoA carboxylase alpha subunit
MIAKVIVWDENRPRAIQKMIRVLKDSTVFGVHTNIPYLIEILSHDDFIKGTMTTRFIENNFSEGLKSNHNEMERLTFSKQVYKDLILKSNDSKNNVIEDRSSPWSGYWRNV